MELFEPWRRYALYCVPFQWPFMHKDEEGAARDFSPGVLRPV